MDWINSLVQGILLGGFYALLATGLSLVFGVMRLVNLAHGDLGILAAFLAVSVFDLAGIGPLGALVIVVPLMFAFGYLLQRLVLNATLDRGVLAPLLVTFGLAVIIQNGLLSLYSADSRGLDAGSLESASVRLTDALAIGLFPVITLLCAVAVLIGLQLVLSRTQIGRVMRATADDPSAARLMGINDRHIYALAMGLALATVAIAGVFLGIRTTFAPLDGPVRLIFAFEAVIIGGLGSLWGTLVGGIVLGVAQAIGGKIDPAYQLLAGHVVFLLVLAFRPQGLFARPTQRQA